MHSSTTEPHETRSRHARQAAQLSIALAQNCAESAKHQLSIPAIYHQLQWLDQQFPNFNKILSDSIVDETLKEISNLSGAKLISLPEITYIIPIHNCDPNLIAHTIQSLSKQVAVQVSAIFILDGKNPADTAALTACLAPNNLSINTRVIQLEHNQGVAAARNIGMEKITTEFFSWLDANDVIHPLRSLHGILRLTNTQAIRINTSYSRVILKTGKLVLRNHRFGHTGHTSFIARTEILEMYGYLVNLKAHEDTEYQERLEYFNANMCSTTVIAHYLDLNPGSTSHLSHDTWESLEIIENHSYLGATYCGKPTPARLRLNEIYRDLYHKVLNQALTQAFPAQFTSTGLAGVQSQHGP
ncbi:MAG: glycosyltransferase [Synechococcus sp.]